MRLMLQILLAVGGVTAIGISLLHIVLGPASIPGSVPVNATMDSEDRFYATLFTAYGGALLWCVSEVKRKTRQVQLLALVFLLGGLARLVSIAAVGLPNGFFMAMTALELVLPFVLLAMARAVARR